MNIYRRVLERCLPGWRRDWDKTVLGASSSSFTPAHEEKIQLLFWMPTFTPANNIYTRGNTHTIFFRKSGITRILASHV